MKKMIVVDAMMGRGKSSAAIQYMNDNKGEKKFLYVTPYLTEVERVCELCDFDEPNQNRRSKLVHLKSLMRDGYNVALTHALFLLMDDEALSLAAKNRYSIIIDETIPVVKTVKMSKGDRDLLLEKFVDVRDDGSIEWRDGGYSGKFDEYRDMVESGSLRYVRGSMYEVMDIRKITSFEEVFVLTYMFDGQIMKAYLDRAGIPYETVGIKVVDGVYSFSDEPDSPPPSNISSLVSVVGEGDDKAHRKLNDVGDDRNSLSRSWFQKSGRSSAGVRTIRNNLNNFFDRLAGRSCHRGDRLWTIFKDYREWVLGQNGRYSRAFVALNARATNAYRDTTRVAYLVNRFVDPNITKFFLEYGISISQESFALSEMLQFIWRSAIRDGRPITVYIPSRRMRELFLAWMREVDGGEVSYAE